MRKLLIPLLGLLLASCSSSVCNNDDYQFLGKIDLGSRGATKFLVVNRGATNEEIKGVASTACGSSRFCRLLIWDSKLYAETRFPLSEIAAEKQIATYIHNPSKNFEKLIVRGEEISMGECSNR